MSTDISALARQVAELTYEVRFLKSKIDSIEPGNAPSPAIDPAIVNDVLAFTRTLFGGEVQMAEREDPEFPEDRYAMLYAQTTLPEDEIGRRQREWHKTIVNIARGKHGYFRLFVQTR